MRAGLAGGGAPLNKVVGLRRVELLTSPLSGVRSNQLSYRPVIFEVWKGCADSAMVLSFDREDRDKSIFILERR